MTINLSDSRMQMAGMVFIAAGATIWVQANPAPADIALSHQKAATQAITREKREQLRTAERRAGEALERLNNGCTVVVLEDKPWISPSLTEGQGAVDSDGLTMQSGFVCTTTHTAEVVNGLVTDVIAVPPEDSEQYIATLRILEKAREQRFQQIPTTGGY